MLTYYLDGQRIDAPGNLDGLTLRKSRHRIYWGFLYRRLGYVQGLGNLLFQQASATDYLRSRFGVYGVQGETTFRIDEDGIELYSGYIDYTTWSDDGFAVSLGLRDSRAVADLESGAATVYGLATKTTLRLPARRLGGTPTLSVNPNLATVQRSSASPLFLTHFVPLKRINSSDTLPNGTLLDVVNPLDSGTIYRNDTGKTQLVSVAGVVVVSASTNSNVAVNLEVVVGSDQVTAYSGSVGGTATTLTAVVNAAMSVPPGASLSLMWWGDAPVNKFTFTYDQARTQVSLSDEATVPPSMAWGLTLREALAELVSRTTAGKLSLVSKWLTSGDGAGAFLATGAGVRGLQSDMPVSLQTLFVGLNKLDNLAMWVDGNKLHIEPKADQPRRISSVRNLIGRIRRVAADYLYSSVAVGYQTWKADSILAGGEPNGQRSYSTAITTVRNELNLVSDLVTASDLIEQQRRLQFDPKTAGVSASGKLDESLFLICAVATATGLQAETRERTDYIIGVHDPDTVFNLRLTPARNLARWADWLGASGPLALQSVQGSSSLISSYDGVLITESSPPTLAGKVKAPMLVTLELAMTLDEYAELGDWIADEDTEAELLDAEWRKTENGTVATLTLLER